MSDFAVQSARSFGPSYFRHTVIPALLLAFSVAFLDHFVLESFFLTAHPHDLTAQLKESLVRILLGGLVALPLMLFSFAWMMYISVRLTSGYILGDMPTDSQLEKGFSTHIWKVFLSSVRTSVISVAPAFVALAILLAAFLQKQESGFVLSAFGWIFLLVEFFWFFLYASYQRLAPTIVIVEGMSVTAAAKRSRALLSGRKGMGSIPVNTLLQQQFVILFIGAAAYAGLSLPLSAINITGTVTSMLGAGWVSSIINAAIEFLPFFAAVWICYFYLNTATTFIYFQTRFKYEGYDIQILASDIIHPKKVAVELP